LDTSTGDSLDLVPIGAEYGKGRRKGTYGSFLLACYNDESEVYETVTMTGAGLTDENLEKFYKELSEHIIDRPRDDYKVDNTTVDVWFDTKVIWEIKTADLSLSPVYTAGSDFIDTHKGISLRFPRFIRTRPDKKTTEATTSEEIYKMYNDQTKKTKQIDFNEEDFYD
jgi:DNA ligase-1